MSRPDEAMGSNPYAPPRANLERPPGEESVFFFTTSPLKFVVLSFFTFTLYALYWLYRNFRVIREREDSAIMPFWRAFFSPLWAYSCFRRIADAAGHSRAQAGWLAFAYFVLNVGSRAPDPWGFMTFAAFLPMIPPNSWARAYNLTIDPALEENSRFSAANWAWIVAFGLLWVLGIIGAFLPPQD